jgi:hypothetical protein
MTVTAVPPPQSSSPTGTFDLIENFKETCPEAFQQLVNDDRAYRDALSRASALVASAASTRLSRRALVVSGTSLLGSITAVLPSGMKTAPGESSGGRFD